MEKIYSYVGKVVVTYTIYETAKMIGKIVKKEINERKNKKKENEELETK